jgi:hypothetical protein
LLKLKEIGRIEIRLHPPQRGGTIPGYLNCFYESKVPSTVRDRRWTAIQLGEDQIKSLKRRFGKTVADSDQLVSIDTLSDNRRRAYRTAETAYLQLWALGHEKQAVEFEALALRSVRHAFDWLELCRLFLIGPVHYSLGGIHCTAQDRISSIRQGLLNAELAPATDSRSLMFPSDLGVVLVKTFGLFQVPTIVPRFSLDDCVGLYQEFELARRALLQLNEDIRERRLPPIETVESLREILRKHRKSERVWLASIRTIAAIALGIATHGLGLLAELGFVVGLESASPVTDRVAKVVSDKIERATHAPSLALLFRLEEELKKKFVI